MNNLRKVVTFATAGPRVWNSLPIELQQCDSRSWAISAVSEDFSLWVVELRRFVTFCKIAPYINSLTYLLTYLESAGRPGLKLATTESPVRCDSGHQTIESRSRWIEVCSAVCAMSCDVYRRGHPAAQCVQLAVHIRTARLV